MTSSLSSSSKLTSGLTSGLTSPATPLPPLARASDTGAASSYGSEAGAEYHVMTARLQPAMERMAEGVYYDMERLNVGPDLDTSVIADQDLQVGLFIMHVYYC